MPHLPLHYPRPPTLLWLRQEEIHSGIKLSRPRPVGLRAVEKPDMHNPRGTALQTVPSLPWRACGTGS